MSASLTKARAQIARVGGFLKQGKPLPAATALQEALSSMLRQQLMKAERAEFAKMIEQAVYLLNNNAELRKSYPLILPYKPGEEKELLAALNDLLGALQTEAVDEAKDQIEQMEQRRSRAFEQGRELLAKKEIAPARKLLSSLVREHPSDSALRAEVAELFIEFEYYEDAFNYLDEALALSPEQLHLYNRIGIVLRKMRQFDVAEKYFMRAVAYAKHDPNLYFNLGRLYVDWQRYDKAEKAAKLALGLDPDFKEAHKLLVFSRRKLDGAG
ncbi:tetratricopeptide repeat protein [Fundidesulfovibrio butyratiphilus]